MRRFALNILHFPHVRVAALSLALLLALAGIFAPAFSAPPQEAAHEEAAEQEIPEIGRKVDFAKEVFPIFEQRCFMCHGPDAQQAELRLDSKTVALEGGVSGPSIIPGNAGKSDLYKRVAGIGDLNPMPLVGERLSPEQIGLIRAWITQGAEWPDDVGVQEAGVERHWAYVKPERPEIPTTRSAERVRNPVDNFVFARLEEEGLTPAPEASKTTLARRLSLDLRGLPPEPEEVERFLAGHSERAYENLVDRMLNSPRFGEHWANYWLDMARYADTNGYESDEPREMWAYRDWVISAFNRNLPFDQFTIEQIAGDLLPNPAKDQIIATGFHRNTLINNEAGAKNDEFYDAAVKDRVDTTAAVWLGSTFGCAQCHDHKYDPFKQTEYYEFYAFFNNTTDSGIRVTDQLDVFKGDREELARREKEVARLRKTLDTPAPGLAAAQKRWEAEIAPKLPEFENAWRVLKPVSARTQSEAKLEVRPDGSVAATGEVPDTDSYELEFKTNLEHISALRLEALPAGETTDEGPGRNEAGEALLTAVEVEAWTDGLERRHQRLTEDAVEWGPWHTIGPFRVKSRAEAFETGFPPEKEVDLLAVYENSNLAWIEMENWKHGKVYHFPFAAEHCANYIYRTVTAEKPKEVRVSLGSYKGFKVWLNGELIASGDPTRTIAPDQDWLTLPLKAGENELLLKFTNDAGPYGFYFRPYVGAEEEARVKLTSALAEHYEDELRRVPALLDGSTDKGWRLAPADIEGGRTPYLLLLPESTIEAGGPLTLRIRLDHVLDRGMLRRSENKGLTLGRFRISASTVSRDVAEELARTPEKVREALETPRAQRSAKQEELIAAHYRFIAPELEETRSEYRARKQALDEFRDRYTTTTLVMNELPEPRETHRQNRGNFLDPAERVYPGVPKALGSIEDVEDPDRLTLAKWLVSDDNPLTARVRVNQIWMRIFGEGLVHTPEDFGTQSDPPTHPKLLDWLAVEFMESGWDTKRLMKTIVMSSVYRQTSKVTKEKLQKDPDNKLLSRGARYRLRAETIRDAALAASGLLSDQVGGPSVFPPQPAAVLDDRFIEGGFKEWPESRGEDRYRRGLYTFYKRTSVYPMYTTFDAPDRTVCTVERNRSNTPLQALNILNDPVFFNAAAALAQRMLNEGGDGVRDRIAHGFRLTLARAPSKAESDRLLRFYDKMAGKYGDRESAKRLMASLNLPWETQADPRELAPWVLVANVLLNLDETFTRE